MKLNLFRKVCLTVMGVGVVSSLVSVGTFATFTATTTNPGNSFAAGTLTLTNVTSATGVAGQTLVSSGSTPAPQTFTTNAAGTSAECNTAVVASACNAVLQSSKVVASGVEPGEYVQGQLTVTNTGSLPATVALQVQNLATAVPVCGTGIVACADPGPALKVTIEDTTFNANAGQCLFGDATGAAAPSGTPLKAVAGHCSSLITANALGSGSAGANPPANSVFGACLAGTCNPATATAGSLANRSFNSNAGSTLAGSLIFVPGAATTRHSLTQATIGDITTINQWTANNSASGSAAEAHTFLITVAFPDTGFLTNQALGSDSIVYGNDNKYQNSSVSFDLVFYAFQ